MKEDIDLILIENELSSLNIGDQFLIEVLKENKENWERFLKIACKIKRKNYHKAIADILINSGFEVEDKIKFENKIKVYLSRMK